MSFSQNKKLVLKFVSMHVDSLNEDHVKQLVNRGGVTLKALERDGLIKINGVVNITEKGTEVLKYASLPKQHKWIESKCKTCGLNRNYNRYYWYDNHPKTQDLPECRKEI